MRPIPRKRIIRVAAALLSAGVLLVAWYTYRPGAPTDGPWTAARLCRVLAEQGLDYEVQTIGNAPGRWGGTYLRRDGMDWDVLAAQSPQAFARQPGHLRIVAIPPDFAAGSDFHPDEADGRVMLGNLIIFGHPDELRRVMDVVRR